MLAFRAEMILIRLALPLGVDDNEPFPLDLTVETKPIFAVGEPLIWFSETRGVGEGLGGEPKVEATVLDGGKGSAPDHSGLSAVDSA